MISHSKFLLMITMCKITLERVETLLKECHLEKSPYSIGLNHIHEYYIARNTCVYMDVTSTKFKSHLDGFQYKASN